MNREEARGGIGSEKSKGRSTNYREGAHFRDKDTQTKEGRYIILRYYGSYSGFGVSMTKYISNSRGRRILGNEEGLAQPTTANIRHCCDPDFHDAHTEDHTAGDIAGEVASEIAGKSVQKSLLDLTREDVEGVVIVRDFSTGLARMLRMDTNLTVHNRILYMFSVFFLKLLREQ